VQRSFSTFPGSWPGAGLLLLRLVAGGAAVVRGSIYLVGLTDASLAAGLLGVVTVAGGTFLVAGFLTPGAGIAAGAGVAAIVSGAGAAPGVALSADAVTAFFVLADVVALVLLGPGAVSMDARLFGRREIVIPAEAGTRPGR
jgi:hypothetical protein